MVKKNNLLTHDYIDNGKENAVIMLHAFGGNKRVFKKQVDSLSTKYNLILVDLNGHGESMKNPLHKIKNPSFEYVVEEIIDIMDEYRIEKAHFVGLSLGTMVCAVMAENYPDRMLSISSMGDATNSSLKFKLLIPVGWVSQFIMHYKVTYLFFAHMLIPGKKHKVSRKFLIREAMKIGHKEFFAWYNMMAKFYKMHPVTNFIGRVPTFYIMGEYDSMFINACKKTHEINLWSKFSMVEGAGHLVKIDSVDEVNRELLEFLGKMDIQKRPAREIEVKYKREKNLSAAF